MEPFTSAFASACAREPSGWDTCSNDEPALSYVPWRSRKHAKALSRDWEALACQMVPRFMNANMLRPWCLCVGACLRVCVHVCASSRDLPGLGRVQCKKKYGKCYIFIFTVHVYYTLVCSCACTCTEKVDLILKWILLWSWSGPKFASQFLSQFLSQIWPQLWLRCTVEAIVAYLALSKGGSNMPNFVTRAHGLKLRVHERV